MTPDDPGLFDDVVLPEPDVLVPEPRAAILERLVGRQVAWFTYLSDPGPYGEAMCALVMVDTDRPIFRAVPVPLDRGGTVFCTAILPWYLDRLAIITPRMVKEYRTIDRTQPEVFQRIQGSLVCGYKFRDEPNPHGGETLAVDLSDQGGQSQTLLIHGMPASRAFTNDLSVQLELGPSRTYFVGGGPAV